MGKYDGSIRQILSAGTRRRIPQRGDMPKCHSDLAAHSRSGTGIAGNSIYT